VRQVIPVEPGSELTLLYPKWLPGFHSPAAAIELLGGLEIRARGERLAWRRDPVEVHAFHVSVPEGAESLDVQFQFLSPTSDAQGTIAVTPVMSAVRWGAMVLYPAGYFSRGIQVQASLTLPAGWRSACALEVAATGQDHTTYEPVPLDVLVDAPVLAGRWFRQVDLDREGLVRLNLVADRPDMIEATDGQLKPHRALIREADALFGARHFDRYEFLTAVSEELGGGGVEHQRSCEIVAPASYFTAWDSNAPKRDVFAHEYVHAWNGKFRRGADSWTPSFERPIRNSLMWVYEGQTQYWGEVLAARSGLWSLQQALDTLARTAAIYDNRPGGRWRTLSDTTRDPIIASRQPLPWRSWQRSEDYYAEGQLLWLDVDTLIRELTGDRRSLDDFARRFFGVEDGRTATSTYEFDDVVAVLDSIVSYEWASLLNERLESRRVGAPLEGLERGGYRLVYRKTNGRAFDVEGLRQAVTDAETTGRIDLLVQRGKRVDTAQIRYAGGHRYPHLEPIEGARPRLDEIHAPLAQ
jgi:predicted metalloprotease with PDZ domain